MIWNLLLASMAFTLVSCGMEGPEDGIDTYRRFEPVTISTEDYKQIKLVCDALKAKEATLQQYVDNQAPFHFIYGEKTCAAESIETINPVTVKMKNLAQDFEFYSTTGQTFGYPKVETSKVGLMADVCNNLAAKVSPIVGASGAGIWFGYVPGNKICQSSENESCMLVEFGKRVQDDSYQIHTREWVKFSVSGQKEGFFTARRSFSSVGCAAGLMVERTATAK